MLMYLVFAAYSILPFAESVPYGYEIVPLNQRLEVVQSYILE